MNLVIVGGTHGNERIGVDFINRYRPFNSETRKILANGPAVEANKRFIDYDLNRSFGNQEAVGSECRVRDRILSEIDYENDFVIDIHSTTSHMGLCLIMSKSNSYSRNIARLISENFEGIKVLESSQLDENSHFLNRSSRHGLLFEIGPCPEGKYQDFQYKQLEQVIEFIEKLPPDQFGSQTMPPFEYYKIFDYVFLPDLKTWAIDDTIIGKDFVELNGSEVLARGPNNERLTASSYQGTYPIFIDEEAYRRLGLIMSLTSKVFDI